MSVVSMVLHKSFWQIAIGLVLRVPLAFLAGHFISSQLYGVSGYDPFALTAAIPVLALCATVAGFIPARRAASIDPMRALRTD